MLSLSVSRQGMLAGAVVIAKADRALLRALTSRSLADAGIWVVPTSNRDCCLPLDHPLLPCIKLSKGVLEWSRATE